MSCNFMYNFISQILLMVGIGGVVYLFARAAPRIDDTLEQKEKDKTGQLLSKIPIEKIDTALSNFWEKLLRRLRVSLLRIDNFLISRLNKMKSSAQLNNKKSDLLTAITSKKPEEINNGQNEQKISIEKSTAPEESKKENNEF